MEEPAGWRLNERRDKSAITSRPLFDVRLEMALRQKFRKEFDCKQANIDIERRLSGATIDEKEPQSLLRADSIFSEQIDLLEKLLTWPTSD